MKTKLRMLLILVGLLSLLTGCDSAADQRIVDLAEKSLEQQARQNELLAEQSMNISEAAKNLVEHDSAARRELLAAQEKLQQELQNERAGLDRQFEELEAERRLIARQRIRDPLIAEALKSSVLIIVCALPLILCWFIVRGIWLDSDADASLGDILVAELVSDQPKLLPFHDQPLAGIEAQPDDPVEDQQNLE